MSKGFPSPCNTCTRVKDPENCENKNCRLWHQWFLESWDRTRMLPALQRQLRQGSVPTVNIGGTQYALPHRIREYLQTDPCKACPFPKELCTSPCPAKRSWIETKKELDDELEE